MVAGRSVQLLLLKPQWPKQKKTQTGGACLHKEWKVREPKIAFGYEFP
jgi:hypothetical protein